MSTHPAAAPRVHYAWIVAGITFVTLLAAAGIRATPGVLIVPFEHEFGWTRATISLAVSVNLILYGLMGPFSAALVDRLGARTTMICAMAILGIGVSLTSLMTASWQLVLLWGIVVGAGSGMIALALAATVVNRWFAERRGLVMGALTASEMLARVQPNSCSSGTMRTPGVARMPAAASNVTKVMAATIQA